MTPRCSQAAKGSARLLPALVPVLITGGKDISELTSEAIFLCRVSRVKGRNEGMKG